MVDEPSKHFPDRIEIEVHNDFQATQTTAHAVDVMVPWRQA
jgi:hypothetical protein